MGGGKRYKEGVRENGKRQKPPGGRREGKKEMEGRVEEEIQIRGTKNGWKE